MAARWICVCSKCGSLQSLLIGREDSTECKACSICGYALKPKTEKINKASIDMSLHPMVDADEDNSSFQ
jgi:Zn ribbon nucleic-acid-binding protein